MSIKEETNLSCIEIEPTGRAQKSVIWLHGLGADGSDFVPIVNELDFPKTFGIRFIFPNAPTRPVTINQGHTMRAWYDITSLTRVDHANKNDMADSATAIEKLIVKEASRGMAPENIILAGFSQGAVMALSTGLQYQKPLAGILALSGYLPNIAHLSNHSIPIFLAHGTEDNVVPYALGKSTYVNLKQAGHLISWHSYTMGHTVCAAEISDIKQWMLTLWR